MRFRIHLQRQSHSRFLPINYQYELSSAIYKVIDLADSEFSKFLHEEGYLAFGRQFRLFTFSRISFEGYKVIREAGRMEHFGQQAFFEISFLVDRAAEEFIKGLFLEQEISIGDRISGIDYMVSSIEATSPPLFEETMHYRCLSPVFIRRKRADGGEDYLHPEDSDYTQYVVQNLLSKSIAYAQTVTEGGPVSEDLPEVAFKPLGKVYKNGVRIKQMTAKESQLIGYMYEFELTAPVELQEVGYYAGFGHLGSQGFGCVGVKGGIE